MTAPPATARLLLREFVAGDLDALAAMLGDPRTLEHWPAPLSREQSQRWIEDNCRRYREDGVGLWAVERLEDGVLLGDCGLWRRDIEGVAEVEIGYHFGRQYWGNGYATEAAVACRNHGAGLGLTRLVALILPANTRSQGVARRIGMAPEREVMHAGRPHDLWARQL